MESNVHNGKFNGNIFIVGRTKCGETYFTRKLTINNFFGKLKKTEWVSYVIPTRERKADYLIIWKIRLHYQI